MENFGEISENALSDTIEDYQVRQLAKDIKEDVSFKLKEGAIVPRGNILEGV